MEILWSSDENKVHRHSSIDQYKGHFFHAVRGGRAVPICFNILKTIKCDKEGRLIPVVRKCILSDGADIGYHFPINDCQKVSDIYLISDYYIKTQKPLPAYYGEGYYEALISGKKIAVSDTEALGIRNVENLRIGMSYITADETLEAVD